MHLLFKYSYSYFQEKTPQALEATAALKSLVSQMSDKEKASAQSPATAALKQLIGGMQITEVRADLLTMRK